MASLQESLPRYLYTSRMALELFDYSPAHYDCLLASLNTPTAYAEMGDYKMRTPAQLNVLAHATRLHPSAVGGRKIDIDLYYMLHLGGVGGPLMGTVTLAQRDSTTSPDLGWAILEEYMGKGYAVEAGREVLRFLTEDFGIKEIIAWPKVSNKRSHRVAEEIGFLEGGVVGDEKGEAHKVYILPAMEFDTSNPLSIWGTHGGIGSP
ncbi:MAG: hypothetical protein MMC33_008748 [Icmadophila ericetorum]|nr:hypothetical protein [Icmadophila ericetorum]